MKHCYICFARFRTFDFSDLYPILRNLQMDNPFLHLVLCSTESGNHSIRTFIYIVFCKFARVAILFIFRIFYDKPR